MFNLTTSFYLALVYFFWPDLKDVPNAFSCFRFRSTLTCNKRYNLTNLNLTWSSGTIGAPDECEISLTPLKMFTFDGHVSEFGIPNTDYNASAHCSNNSKQFSVSSLLRLGHKRRSSDVDSSEGEYYFFLCHYSYFLFFSKPLLDSQKGMRKFKDCILIDFWWDEIYNGRFKV